MKNDLRIIFMGTPDFAVATLDALLKNHYAIVAVVTSPDKPAGRGKKIHQSEVKEYALKNNLTVLQPEKLSDETFIEALKKLKPDLQIVVAFRKLPEAVWKIPTYGTFNLHASILPNYRGAAPINWAIMHGEKETGVTTFFIDEKIDTGKIILSKTTTISENENYGELHEKLKDIGANLVIESIEMIRNKNITLIPQSDFISTSTHLKTAPKIFKDDCKINWKNSAQEIHNFIRGLSPHPGAHTYFIDEKKHQHYIKIFKSSYIKEKHSHIIGDLIIQNKTMLAVATFDGYLFIEILQLEGKKRVSIQDFLNGFSINSQWKAKVE